MTDFINKVISIVLIFIMLVLAPLLISYVSTDMVADRLILNEVTQFIDKVTDRSEITLDDLNSLFLSVNSHGGSYDVDVNVYSRVSTQNPRTLEIGEEVNGTKPLYIEVNGTKPLYIKEDCIDAMLYKYPETSSDVGAKESVSLGKNWVVKVSVKSIGTTPSRNLLWSVLRVDKGDFNITLAGTVL